MGMVCVMADVCLVIVFVIVMYANRDTVRCILLVHSEKLTTRLLHTPKLLSVCNNLTVKP